MRRLPLLAVWILGCMPAQGAVALVAHAAAGADSGGGPVTTAAINTMGANLIVVGATTYGQDSSNIVMTDSNTNNWTRLNNYVDGSDRGNTTIFYCPNPRVSSNQTFTATAGASGNVAVAVTAWSGAATANPLDTQNGGGGDFVTSLETNGVMPSQDNSLVITIIAGQPQSGAPVWSVSAPFSIVDWVPYSASNHLFIADAFEIQTNAVSRNATWTVSNGANILAGAIIVVFKPDAAAKVVRPGSAIWVY